MNLTERQISCGPFRATKPLKSRHKSSSNVNYFTLHLYPPQKEVIIKYAWIHLWQLKRLEDGGVIVNQSQRPYSPLIMESSLSVSQRTSKSSRKAIFKQSLPSSVIICSSMKLMRFCRVELLFRFTRTMNMNLRILILFHQVILKQLRKPLSKLGSQNHLGGISCIQTPNISLSFRSHRWLLTVDHEVRVPGYHRHPLRQDFLLVEYWSN